MSDGPRICKLSGAGNDFVALGPEAIETLGAELVPWIRRVCRRGLSVGADGVLLVEPGREAGRVRVRFFNPDGSAAFCGNGTRCAARYARRRGFVAEDTMVLETAVGDVPSRLVAGGVRLELPPPSDEGSLALALDEGSVRGRRVRAGVPHFVIFVDDVAGAPLARWGPQIRRHERFGDEGTNVDVVGPLGGAALPIRTWERGVEGETLSCGSGAIAGAFAAWREGGGAELRVQPAAGVPLRVRFHGTPAAPGIVELDGDARVIFEATLDTDATRGFEP